MLAPKDPRDWLAPPLFIHIYIYIHIYNGFCLEDDADLLETRLDHEQHGNTEHANSQTSTQGPFSYSSWLRPTSLLYPPNRYCIPTVWRSSWPVLLKPLPVAMEWAFKAHQKRSSAFAVDRGWLLEIPRHWRLLRRPASLARFHVPLR